MLDPGNQQLLAETPTVWRSGNPQPLTYLLPAVGRVAGPVSEWGWVRTWRLRQVQAASQRQGYVRPFGVVEAVLGLALLRLLIPEDAGSREEGRWRCSDRSSPEEAGPAWAML